MAGHFGAFYFAMEFLTLQNQRWRATTISDDEIITAKTSAL